MFILWTCLLFVVSGASVITNNCVQTHGHTYLFNVLRQSIFRTEKVGYTSPIHHHDHHQSHSHCHDNKCHHGCRPWNFFFCRKIRVKYVFSFNLLLPDDTLWTPSVQGLHLHSHFLPYQTKSFTIALSFTRSQTHTHYQSCVETTSWSTAASVCLVFGVQPHQHE